MTLKNLIVTTCLVAPLVMGGAVRADEVYEPFKVLDPNLYLDKNTHKQLLLFENDDVPFKEARHPMDLEYVDPPEDRNECKIEFPEQDDLLFSMNYANNPQENDPDAVDPHGPNGLGYDVTNPNKMKITFKNTRWAKALMVEFSPYVLNYRNADSYDEAAESDRRILPVGASPAVYKHDVTSTQNVTPPSHSNSQMYWVNWAKSEDNDEINRAILTPKGDKFNHGPITLAIHPLQYRVALKFQSWNTSSEPPEDWKDVLLWEDSTYEIVINAFCLDEDYNKLAAPGTEVEDET